MKITTRELIYIIYSIIIFTTMLIMFTNIFTVINHIISITILTVITICGIAITFIIIIGGISDD